MEHDSPGNDVNLASALLLAGLTAALLDDTADAEARLTRVLPLLLHPAKWSGDGLLGAKIGLPE